MPTNPTSTGPFIWDGSAAGAEEILVTCVPDVAGSLSGKYWNLNHPDYDAYVWYDTGNKEETEVQFTSGNVVTKFAIDGTYFKLWDEASDAYTFWFSHGVTTNTPPSGTTEWRINSQPFIYSFSTFFEPNLATTGPGSDGNYVSVVGNKAGFGYEFQYCQVTKEDTTLYGNQIWSNVPFFTIPGHRGWYDLKHLNGFFWAVGFNSGDADRYIYRSLDGINWSLFSSFTPASVTGGSLGTFMTLTYGDGKYVLSGVAPPGFADIIYSTDASTWLPSTHISSASYVVDFATDDSSIYVAARFSGDIEVSTDAITWGPPAVLPALTSGGYIQKVIWAPDYSGGLFIAASSKGQVLTSPDGQTWTLTTLPFFAPATQYGLVRGLEYGRATFSTSPFIRRRTVLIVQNNTGSPSDTYLYTDDGISWSGFNLPIGPAVGALTYHKPANAFLSVGLSSTIPRKNGAWYSSSRDATPTQRQWTKDDIATITVEEVNEFAKQAVNLQGASGPDWENAGTFTATYSGSGPLTVTNSEYGVITDGSFSSVNGGIDSLTVTVQGGPQSTNPLVPGKNLAIRIGIETDWTAQLVALKTADQLNANPNFSANYIATNQVSVINSLPGNVTDSSDGDIGFTVSVTQQGTSAGAGPPPDNINFGDILLSTKINEVKSNADFLNDNTETCFNEKINLYSDRDTLKRDIRYEDQYAVRRDTVNTQLNATNKDSNWTNVYVTAYTGRRTVAYTSRRNVADRNDCLVASWAKTAARTSDWSGANNSYWSDLGGCATFHSTYHSGVDTTDRAIRDSSEHLTFNSAKDGVDHSARHNIFCTILT